MYTHTGEEIYAGSWILYCNTKGSTEVLKLGQVASCHNPTIGSLKIRRYLFATDITPPPTSSVYSEVFQSKLETIKISAYRKTAYVEHTPLLRVGPPPSDYFNTKMPFYHCDRGCMDGKTLKDQATNFNFWKLVTMGPNVVNTASQVVPWTILRPKWDIPPPPDPQEEAKEEEGGEAVKPVSDPAKENAETSEKQQEAVQVDQENEVVPNESEIAKNSEEEEIKAPLPPPIVTEEEREKNFIIDWFHKSYFFHELNSVPPFPVYVPNVWDHYRTCHDPPFNRDDTDQRWRFFDQLSKIFAGRYSYGAPAPGVEKTFENAILVGVGLKRDSEENKNRYVPQDFLLWVHSNFIYQPKNIFRADELMRNFDSVSATLNYSATSRDQFFKDFTSAFRQLDVGMGVSAPPERVLGVASVAYRPGHERQSGFQNHPVIGWKVEDKSEVDAVVSWTLSNLEHSPMSRISLTEIMQSFEMSYGDEEAPDICEDRQLFNGIVEEVMSERTVLMSKGAEPNRVFDNITLRKEPLKNDIVYWLMKNFERNSDSLLNFGQIFDRFHAVQRTVTEHQILAGELLRTLNYLRGDIYFFNDQTAISGAITLEKVNAQTVVRGLKIKGAPWEGSAVAQPTYAIEDGKYKSMLLRRRKEEEDMRRALTLDRSKSLLERERPSDAFEAERDAKKIRSNSYQDRGGYHPYGLQGGSLGHPAVGGGPSFYASFIPSAPPQPPQPQGTSSPSPAQSPFMSTTDFFRASSAFSPSTQASSPSTAPATKIDPEGEDSFNSFFASIMKPQPHENAEDTLEIRNAFNLLRSRNYSWESLNLGKADGMMELGVELSTANRIWLLLRDWNDKEMGDA